MTLLINMIPRTTSGMNMIRPTSTNGLQSGPDFVSLASPHRLADDHVAVVALVGDEGVVSHRVEHHASEGRVRGSGAGDR